MGNVYLIEPKKTHRAGPNDGAADLEEHADVRGADHADVIPVVLRNASRHVPQARMHISFHCEGVAAGRSEL